MKQKQKSSQAIASYRIDFDGKKKTIRDIWVNPSLSESDKEAILRTIPESALQIKCKKHDH